jgi:hypothetical protein
MRGLGSHWSASLVIRSHPVRSFWLRRVGLVTATIDEPRGGKVKSGFMLRRHLATAPSLRLGRSAA